MPDVIVLAIPMWIPRIDFSSDQPVFRAIVQALADDIAAGRLSKGDRLPTHRELAEVLGVARGTLAHAYAQAEKHGLIRSEVGRGTFVMGAESSDRPYGTLLEPPVIANDMSGNFPLSGIDPDPADAFAELAMRPDRMALLRYQSHLGLRRHRMAGVEWARRLGVDAKIDSVLVCAGAQHALFVVLAHLLGPGDPLMVEEWSYPGLHAIAETLRIRLVAVEMDGAGLDPDALEHACKSHRARVLYCMPTAHNPVGTTQPAARRQALLHVARRHGVRIIEDAANQLLVPDCPPPLASYAPGQVYFIASTSKILGAGLRVAFLVAPSVDVEAIGRHVWATQWMVSPIGPEMVTIWLENGTADQTISRKRREGLVRQSLARKILAGHDVQGYSGVFHLWLILPGRSRVDTLVAEALRHNVAVSPGSAFWMRATRARGAIRVALGGLNDRQDLARGLRTLARLLPAP